MRHPNVLLLLSGGVLLATVGATQSTETQPADLALHNGKIVTVDDRNPQAEALAARGDRIVALGRNDVVKKLVGPKTRVIDLQGRMAMPGFIEGHGHFTSLGQSRMMLDLTTAKTWDGIVAQVEAAARKTPEGQWILGRGWHQEKWSRRPEPHVEGYPTHEALSMVTPKHPVLLTHASGHMSFANALAMQLAGVNAATRPPAGGEILRDAAGNPTGAFREAAQGLISRAHGRSLRERSPEDARRDLRKAIDLAMDECLAKGVTSFQDAGSSFETIDVFKTLADEQKLKVRLWVMVRASNEEMARRLKEYRMIGGGNHFVTVRGIKRSLDGALGPHGAWLLEPYEDLPMSMGLNLVTIDSLRETARLAVEHDYQLCVHAIGDRANRETLNVFEETFRKHPSKELRRWRVEHAQHLHPDDLPRFAKLGVIASMQGIHCTSDAVFVLRRLGQRRAEQGAYVWQSLIRSGALVSNGTDVPVEDVSPIASFHASVTRKLANGAVFFREQCMTREQALKSYTWNAAYAAFEEDLKGSLAPGKLADIVVLSEDLLTAPEEKLRNARVLYTIVGGQVRYEAQ
jgi:hypothetical protein